MKLVLSSLAILFATSAVSAAGPQAPSPSAPAVATAATPAPPSLERQQLARQYIGLALSADEMIETMESSVSSHALADLVGADESARAEGDRKMARFLTLYEPKLRERLPNLMEAYAQVYAREFSAEELRGMVSFAQSPAGRHYLSRRVALEFDPAILMQAQGFQNDALPIMQQIDKEMCQERTAQRIAAGDKNAKCPLSEPETQAG